MRTAPDACLLLVDTYDTLKSGVPNAIRVFTSCAKGHEPAVRLDSGDLAYLTREARQMMDEAGFPREDMRFGESGRNADPVLDCRAPASTSGAWAPELITSMDCPALGGVYKLSARMEDGQLVPKIKISENPAKITNPGVKSCCAVRQRHRQGRRRSDRP